jgi:hypothetical protein
MGVLGFGLPIGGLAGLGGERYSFSCYQGTRLCYVLDVGNVVMPGIDLNQLKGLEAEILQRAILGAFNPATFQQALKFKLNKKLDEVAGPGPFAKRVFDVIELSQEESWTADLVRGLRSANSTNIQLLRVAETFELVELREAPLPAEKTLERIIRDDGGFSDPVLWAERMAALQRRICRIERPVNSAVGTGFLVGSDLLLTNHHVMAKLIAKQAQPADVACRFDYAVGPAGASPGKTCQLASDWHVASSPPSRADVKPETGPADKSELDYCLTRLAERVGDDQDAQNRQRGWIAVPAAAPMPADGDILLVMQHPQGLPVKLAIGAALAPNENNSRLRHDVNTKPGSSGSPCFDAKLALVALHHAGDPFYDAPDKPKYNQAIPMRLIVEQLAGRGVARFWEA